MIIIIRNISSNISMYNNAEEFTIEISKGQLHHSESINAIVLCCSLQYLHGVHQSNKS